MMPRAWRNFAFLSLVALFLLSACSDQEKQEGENATRLTHENETKKVASGSDHPRLPNLAALVEAALLSDSALAKPSPNKDILVIEYDSLFVLLGSLERALQELRASVNRATNSLSRGEFETTKMWEERKTQAAIQAEKNNLTKISRLCGTSVVDSDTFFTSAKVSSDTFIYDPDRQTMMLNTQLVEFENARIQLPQINQYMYDIVKYHYIYDKEKRHNICTSFTLGNDNNTICFKIDFDGPSFSPDTAPLFKKAVTEGKVIADIEFMLKYSTEQKNIDPEIISVTFRDVDGDSLMRWGSVIKSINFASGRKFYREIVVTRNIDALKKQGSAI